MRKTSRRSEKQAESAFILPSEAVHVEHNLIVEWLLKLRAIARRNQKFLRNMFISMLTALVISGMIIFIYTSLSKKHNYLFFTYLDQYQELKKVETEDSKKEKFTKLAQDTHKLCHVFWKTSHSYNACLLEAASYIELGEPEKTSTALDLFSNYNSKNGAGVYVLFFAAQAYENLLDYQRAYEIYNQLEQLLKPLKQDDIAVFHKAKILFLQNKLDLAEQIFHRIAKDFSTSKFLSDSRNFLKLIALQKSNVLK